MMYDSIRVEKAVRIFVLRTWQIQLLNAQTRKISNIHLRECVCVYVTWKENLINVSAQSPAGYSQNVSFSSRFGLVLININWEWFFDDGCVFQVKFYVQFFSAYFSKKVKVEPFTNCIFPTRWLGQQFKGTSSVPFPSSKFNFF